MQSEPMVSTAVLACLLCFVLLCWMMCRQKASTSGEPKSRKGGSQGRKRAKKLPREEELQAFDEDLD